MGFNLFPNQTKVQDVQLEARGVPAVRCQYPTPPSPGRGWGRAPVSGLNQRKERPGFPRLLIQLPPISIPLLKAQQGHGKLPRKLQFRKRGGWLTLRALWPATLVICEVVPSIGTALSPTVCAVCVNWSSRETAQQLLSNCTFTHWALMYSNRCLI